MKLYAFLRNTRPGVKFAALGVGAMCVLGLGAALMTPQHAKSEATLSSGAVLRGFQPGTEISYRILPQKGASVAGHAAIDERGELTIPAAISDQDLTYDLTVQEKGKADPVTIALSLGDKTSIDAKGFDDFAPITIERDKQTIQSKADWSGQFKNQGPGPIKGGALKFAYLDGNVASDIPRNPKIIEVFSAPGGGGPTNAKVNQWIFGEYGECGGAYGGVGVSTCDNGTLITQATNVVNNYVIALQMMTQQLEQVMMHDVFMIGTLIDAKQQLETQRNFQTLTAQAHKDYQPSDTMCQIGSFIKSVPAAEAKAAFDKQALNSILMQDYANAKNTSGAEGYAIDIMARIKQFREVYCDPADNNNGLSYMCEWDQSHTLKGSIGASDHARENKDIDYARTMESPLTLNIDFSKGTKTNDEEDIVAMARNLYWPRSLESAQWKGLNADFRVYMDARKLFAIQNIAHNSFIQIAAMKSRADDGLGAAAGWNFMKSMMREFGMNDADINKTLGDYPSYYAQMEVLTKKIYESPDFYTNLMDTPANIKRISVSLDAIKVMQQRDMLESLQRREMLDSMMVEEELAKPVDRINGQMARAVKDMR